MKKLSRRTLITGALATATLSGAYVLYPARVVANGDLLVSPQRANELIRQSEVLLIDVRRPDEWARTGIAKGAVPIDLRRRDFIEAVKAAQEATGGLPLAVICARGVRSRRMAAAMTKAGLGDIIDIPEGMLGSSAGPGWLARGLPTQKWTK
ncbi:rhodanese-like domain-containing protein [Planktotalea sp.]|uniref:rhodanese-like domain-containing protein n=1 Tax=Planktotalea sp. TaxID=2029877 RepID=UPI003298792D